VPLSVHGEAARERRVPVDVSDARLLVVDDREVNRAILLEQLGSWRFGAEAVGSGREALAALRRAAAEGWAFDLVVLDFHMPGMDGGEVLAAVRGMEAEGVPALAATPVVTLTSVDQQGDGRFFRDLGADAHLLTSSPSYRTGIFGVVPA
jgi:CheY-like chemotaxis protein